MLPVRSTRGFLGHQPLHVRRIVPQEWVDEAPFLRNLDIAVALCGGLCVLLLLVKSLGGLCVLVLLVKIFSTAHLCVSSAFLLFPLRSASSETLNPKPYSKQSAKTRTSTLTHLCCLALGAPSLPKTDA